MGFKEKAALSAALAFAASSASAQETVSALQVATGVIPAWATRSDPLPVPVDASGLAFVRVQDVLIHLDGQGQSTFLAQRIALLHPQALQMGNLALAWNPASGMPTVHAVRIYRGAEVIDVLEGTKFEILRREDQLEQAALTGILTAVLRIPDLRVGDELELSYTLPSSDPTLRDLNAGLLAMQGTMLPGRYRLGLSWEEGEEPRVHATDDFGGTVERTPTAIDIRTDNPATLTPPKDAPPRYNWQRFIEYSDFPDWTALSSRFHGLFADASRLSADSPLKQEAARIATQHPTALERAQAVLTLVQDQVRYVYVGLDGGNYKPASADVTWQRRYGDCKAKSALLLALLGELGIPARAVLANNVGFDDGIDGLLPSPGLFDHVLVNAEIDGKTYWLDGTMPGVIEMQTRPIIPYRWVLPLLAKGAALESVAPAVAVLPDEMGLFEIDARQGFDKPARKVSTSVKRGIEAVAEYYQFSAVSADQLKVGLRNTLVGNGEWDEIEDATYRFDRKTQASILTIVGTGAVDWDDMGDGEYQLALPGGGFGPPNRRQRSSEQDQAAPYYNEPGFSCYATTVRLPEGTDLENWGFNTTFDTMMFGRLYYRMMEKRKDMTIRMVRGSRVERSEVGPGTARRDNERIERFDNSKANITYDPSTVMRPWGNLRPVPATYEIDWTGTDVPCLPTDLRDEANAGD